MAYEDLILEKEGNIAIITLNRPDRLNAISPAMRDGFPKALEEVRQDDDIRVMILTGAGRGFCSGADVSGQAARLAGEAAAKSRRETLEVVGHIGMLIRELEKPTIAAVNGVAAGAGFSYAMACDIRFASDRARFISVFVRRGLVPDSGLTYFLPRLVGTSKACEIMFTGNPIDAEEALRIGLVSKVVPHDDLMNVAREFASVIAKGPPISLELTKKAIYRGIERDLRTQMDFESYAQTVCRGTEDHREGVRSFMEKREPIFKGS